MRHHVHGQMDEQTDRKSDYLRGCQTNDKVSRLLWAWFSWPTKLADKIGEPWHTADIFVCYFVRYQLAQQPNAAGRTINN